MNDQRLEKKIIQDAARIKKDLNTLAMDSAARLSRLENNVNHVTGKAKEDLTTWVDDGASQLTESYEKLTGDAKKAVVVAVASVKKDVGHGLSQYNSKAQKVANTVPGGFGKKAAMYPWVTISMALIIGFVVGNLLKPVCPPVA